MATSRATPHAEAGVQTSSSMENKPTLDLAKPLTQEAIVFEQPSLGSNTCIHREELKNLSLDLLKDYAEHYNIKIDNDTLLRSEIAATLCLKNEYIPILPTHEVARQDGRVLLSRCSKFHLESATDTTSPNAGKNHVAACGTWKDEYDVEPGSSNPPSNTDSSIPPTSSSDDVNASPDDIDFASLASINVTQTSNLISQLQSRYARLQSAFQDAMTAHAASTRAKARLQSEELKMKMALHVLDGIVGKSDMNRGDEGRTSSEGGEEGSEVMQQDKGKGKEKGKEQNASPADPEEPRFLLPKMKGKETDQAGPPAKDALPTINSPTSTRETRCYSKTVQGNAGDCFFICGLHDLAHYFDQRSTNIEQDHTHSAPAVSSSSGINPTPTLGVHHRKWAKNKRPLDEGDSDQTQDNHHSSSVSESGPKQSRKRARLERDENTFVQGSSTGGARGSNPSRGRGSPLRRTYACYNLDDPVAVAQEFSGVETPIDGHTSIRRTRMPLRRTYAYYPLEDVVDVAGEFVGPTTTRTEMMPAQTPATRWRNSPLTRSRCYYNLEDPAEGSQALEERTAPRMIFLPGVQFDMLWGPGVRRQIIMAELEEYWQKANDLGHYSTFADPHSVNPMPPPPTPTRRRVREEEEEEDSGGRQKKKAKLQEGLSEVAPIIGSGSVDEHQTNSDSEDRDDDQIDLDDGSKFGH